MNAILLALLIAAPGNPSSFTAGNPKEGFSGSLPSGVCYKFNGGTWSQICSPADGQVRVGNNATTSTLDIYTTTTGDAIEPPNMTTDASGVNFTIKAANVAANALDARTPGNVVLAGGLDSKTAYFADANPDTGGHCPGTTVVLAVNGTATTYTYNTYCAGGCTTIAAATTALAGAITATNTAGTTATTGAITGGAANAVLVQPGQPATTNIQWSGATATCLVVSNGVDGCIFLGTGTGTSPVYMSVTMTGQVLFGSSCASYSGTALYAGAVFTTGGVTSYGGSVGQTASGGSLLGTSDSVGAHGIYLVAGNGKGATSLWTQNVATATFAAGGSATVTLAGLVPLGATNLSVTGRVITAESGGGCTSFSVGDGTIAALYALTVPITLAQTFGPTVASYGPTAAIPTTQLTNAGNVVLTSVGGAGCKNMVVRVTASYFIAPPDTTN